MMNVNIDNMVLLSKCNLKKFTLNVFYWVNVTLQKVWWTPSGIMGHHVLTTQRWYFFVTSSLGSLLQVLWIPCLKWPQRSCSTDFVSPFFAVLIMDILVFESCSNDPTYNCKKPELEKCTIPWINEMDSKFCGISVATQMTWKFTLVQ